MQRGWSRPSLGERAADSGIAGARPTPDDAGRGAGDAGRDSGAPAPAPRRGETGRHCWVTDPPEWPGTWPGLLVEWRQHPGGWQGRVIYTITGPHGPVLVETWLPADHLRQR
jgi:hypothetical protein